MITGFIPLYMVYENKDDHITRLTRRVLPVEQELLSIPEHLRSTPVFSGVHVTRSMILWVCLQLVDVCPFVLFLFAIVFSVLHRYTDSDYLFDIFRLEASTGL